MSHISFICPDTLEELQYTASGLITTSGDIKYSNVNGVYRLVSYKHYAENFSLEWNTFQRSQIDKFNGTKVSYNRLFTETGWSGDLSGENILEIGSGAGRFSQVILDYTKANLYSVDLSEAVEANYNNNGPHARLHLFQADLYQLPFRKHQFDKVVCIGVLQHTPDFRMSITFLVDMVKPGGELVVDFYPIKGWYTKINAKYMLRPFIKNMEHKRLMRLIANNINWLIWLYKFNQKIGLSVLNRFVPVCDIDSTFPDDDAVVKEWAILDTFDMYSPRYDHPQRLHTVKKWFEEAGMIDVKAEMIEYEKGLYAATVKGKRP